jgi:hypothetical protein
LRPGDRVDVVATAGGTSYVLVQHALVLAMSSGRNGPLAGGDVTVALALDDPTAALAVTHGASAAELTLLRSTRATEPLPAAFQLPSATGGTGVGATGSVAGPNATTTGAATGGSGGAPGTTKGS